MIDRAAKEAAIAAHIAQHGVHRLPTVDAATHAIEQWIAEKAADGRGRGRNGMARAIDRDAKRQRARRKKNV